MPTLKPEFWLAFDSIGRGDPASASGEKKAALAARLSV
jgi:hypothetical protein